MDARSDSDADLGSVPFRNVASTILDQEKNGLGNSPELHGELVRSTQQRGKLLDKWFCVLRCPKLVSVSIRLLPGSSAHFSKHVKQLNMLNPLDRISPARSRRGGRRVHRTHVLGLSRIWPLPSDSIATGRHGRCHLEPRWTGLSWSQGGDETVGRGEARSWMKK